MEDQLHRPFTLPEKKSLHIHAGTSEKMSATTSPAVMVSTPKTAPHPQSKHPLASPRACLCSPTTHAGSFRCRLHRGVGGGGLSGSVGSGLHEIGQETQGKEEEIFACVPPFLCNCELQ